MSEGLMHEEAWPVAGNRRVVASLVRSSSRAPPQRRPSAMPPRAEAGKERDGWRNRSAAPIDTALPGNLEVVRIVTRDCYQWMEKENCYDEHLGSGSDLLPFAPRGHGRPAGRT